MTDRMMYQPTEKQQSQWSNYQPAETPTDDEFMAKWAKQHHGKTSGWGMAKRNWLLTEMARTPEYNRGLWQGRVDRARGLEYAEERNENTYNLGYYRGYTEYESNRGGWDRGTRERFDNQYLNI